jgi:hypothetical protein
MADAALLLCNNEVPGAVLVKSRTTGEDQGEMGRAATDNACFSGPASEHARYILWRPMGLNARFRPCSLAACSGLCLVDQEHVSGYRMP